MKFEYLILIVNKNSCASMFYVLQSTVNKKFTFSYAHDILCFQFLGNTKIVKDLHIIFWNVQDGKRMLFTSFYIQIFKVQLEMNFLLVFYQIPITPLYMHICTIYAEYIIYTEYIFCIIFCTEWKEGGTCPCYKICPKIFIMYRS